MSCCTADPTVVVARRQQLDPPPAVRPEDDCSFLDIEEASLLEVACRELVVPGLDARNSGSAYGAVAPAFCNPKSCHDDQVAAARVASRTCLATQSDLGLAAAAEQSSVAAASLCELDGADVQDVALTIQTVSQTLCMLSEV